MATGAAGDGLLRGVFEGCISGSDMGIQRRPYHKNCRRSWSEGCLALMGVGISSSPCSSPARSPREITRTQTQTQLIQCKEEEETKAMVAVAKVVVVQVMVELTLGCWFADGGGREGDGRAGDGGATPCGGAAAMICSREASEPLQAEVQLLRSALRLSVLSKLSLSQIVGDLKFL
ncbi:unnamed protein product [Fraxinus pennsylvanica]|uniref:Uncharacterized protein n=1 Tax=Fraxinus pennsylvanica TaxID=56036 RepID=A0AAD1YN88_9LAMI|nr:unnamed protein product [Fraxinus pennsylvanica]